MSVLNLIYHLAQVLAEFHSAVFSNHSNLQPYKSKRTYLYQALNARGLSGHGTYPDTVQELSNILRRNPKLQHLTIRPGLTRFLPAVTPNQVRQLAIRRIASPRLLQ